ncbi:butyrophilin subfamily 1 member A1 [Dromiciops gliroides]|uniref:butyrophilin subfamily 1 member A1 n=1 Tax=Dromiciops gliroides TaxID=33562 RepID=UPI001CC35CCC|nr:butyrophilin subfamily 1 member A1 [Dromiciops gliroides]
MLDSARFDVIGPTKPIQVMVGEDVDLPCHLSPNISAENMELRWYRNKISPAVYVYQKEKDQEREQIKEYQGRTTFVRDNITEGNVAVTIHNVRVSDDGQYRCFFKDDQIYEEAIIELKVASLGSDPHIHMEAYGDEGILLECTSAGWYPVPQVLWRNLKGEMLPLLSVSQTPNGDGLITVKASVVIRDHSVGSVSCSIRNPLLNLEKVVRISIPGRFFSRLSPWMMSVAVILTALGLLTIGAIFFIWKLQRNNREKENKSVNKEKFQEELRWEKAQLHAVDITLDPDTAHPYLLLYEGLKSFRLEDTPQKLPDKPERFDSWPCVLGREGFTSGKHYWEVEVGDRTDWAIGVCKENVVKKGFDPMTPENGFWAVELYGNGYWALTPLRTPLPLKGPPCYIGVFLDYESGHISFYDITNASHIYTFPQASFSGTLRPFFCLWSCGKKPLTICPIFSGPDEVTVIANAPVLSKESLVTPTSEGATPGDADTLQRSNSKLFPIQSNNGAPDH